MRLKTLKIVLLLFVVSQGILSCGRHSKTQNYPLEMLWAWERHEDLRFLDIENFGVAYLAQTLEINDKEVVLRPRFQPLEVKPNTYLIAVTRIETYRERGEFSSSQFNEIVRLITKTALREDVKGIQIDFDVKVSEREFYKKIIKRIKTELPTNKSLSITALASFCIGDRWMTDLPIDEAVPMLFEMGVDERQIGTWLRKGKDFPEPLCRSSYGLATYEPLEINYRANRRRYYFNSKPWKKANLEKLK